MAQDDVGFLNPCSAIRIHRKYKICTGGEFTRAAGHANGRNAYFAGGFNRFYDIGRITAGTDAPGNVAFFSKSFNLFRKNIIKMIIVPNAGQNGCIGRQGDGGQGRAFDLKAVDEFGGQVLGICSASAVAENKQLTSRCDTGSQHFRRPDDKVQVVFDAVSLCRDTGFQYAQDDFFHFIHFQSNINAKGLEGCLAVCAELWLAHWVLIMESGGYMQQNKPVNR